MKPPCRWLQQIPRSALPQIGSIVQYQLGDWEGARLGFTDAAVTSQALLFSAAAEDSPDAVRDGRVTGSVVGILDSEPFRWIELRTPDSEPFRGKVEGICPSREAADLLYAVVDVDNPRMPSELCEIELRGPWIR